MHTPLLNTMLLLTQLKKSSNRKLFTLYIILNLFVQNYLITLEITPLSLYKTKNEEMENRSTRGIKKNKEKSM